MKIKFYAVACGRSVGVFYSWDVCVQMVRGYANSIHKSFREKYEALKFI